MSRSRCSTCFFSWSKSGAGTFRSELSAKTDVFVRKQLRLTQDSRLPSGVVLSVSGSRVVHSPSAKEDFRDLAEEGPPYVANSCPTLHFSARHGIGASCAIPDGSPMDSILALRCPTCGHGAARLYISSKSVLTVRCAHCDHVWCVDRKTMPETVPGELGTGNG